MPASEDQAKRFRAKRDFRRTPEPQGEGDSGSSKAPVFVVQVWDRDTYRHITGDDGDDISIDEALENGRIELSNENKVLFPAAGITKGEVVNYYPRIIFPAGFGPWGSPSRMAQSIIRSPIPPQAWSISPTRARSRCMRRSRESLVPTTRIDWCSISTRRATGYFSIACGMPMARRR